MPASSDVVIVGAKRTAIGSFLGQFTGVPRDSPWSHGIRFASGVCGSRSARRNAGKLQPNIVHSETKVSGQPSCAASHLHASTIGSSLPVHRAARYTSS